MDHLQLCSNILHISILKKLVKFNYLKNINFEEIYLPVDFTKYFKAGLLEKNPVQYSSLSPAYGKKSSYLICNLSLTTSFISL